MATRKKTLAEPSIHVRHVERVGIRPVIWRELHVRSCTTSCKRPWAGVFEDLAGRQYVRKVPGDDAAFGDSFMLDERKHTVAELAPRARGRFGYSYDLGDGGVHPVRVKKARPAEPGRRYPACNEPAPGAHAPARGMERPFQLGLFAGPGEPVPRMIGG